MPALPSCLGSSSTSPSMTAETSTKSAKMALTELGEPFPREGAHYDHAIRFRTGLRPP